MTEMASLVPDDGWSHRALRGQGWTLGLAAFFAALSPLLYLVDARCMAAVPEFWSHSGMWFKELVALVRPFGHGEILLLLAVTFGAVGRRRAAAEALIALVLVAVLVWVLKIPVNRVRPTGDPYSFPSGDAATCAILIPVLWNLGGRWRRLAIAALVLTVAVAAARVVKEFHFPSDVAAGMALGIIAGVAAHALVAGRRIPVSARWFLIATGVTVSGCAIGLHQKMLGGDTQPLMPPFLAAAIPALLLVVIATWQRTSERRIPQRWASLAVIALGIGALLLFVATRSTLWDRDETFYAQTAQEMHRSGDYLVPTYNTVPFLHKPPLTYWLMSWTQGLCGPTELAFRMWSCVALAMTLALLGRLGARLLGNKTSGTRLALVFATMPLVLVVGGAATTDAVLLLGLVIAMLPWWTALADGAKTSSWWRALIMGLGMGIGMLAKAPLGIAVPMASLVLAWWLLRRAARRELAVQPPPPLMRDLTIATAIGTLCYLGWAIPTNLVTNGEFLQVAIFKHVVGRALAPMESHGGPLWRSFPYYAVVVVIACLPWTAYLPAAWSALLGGRLGDVRLRVIASAWFVPTFVLMTCVATKLPHYILPALPGLALAIAATLDAAETGRLDARDRRWLRHGRWLLAALFIPLGLGLMIAPWFLAVDDPRPGEEPFATLFRLRHAALGLGVVFFLLPLLTWRTWMTRPSMTARILAAGMVIVALSAGVFVLPSLEAFKPSAVVGAKIQAASERSVPVVTAGYDEPSLLFAIDRAPVPDLGTNQSVLDWAEKTAPGIMVITRERLVASGLNVNQAGLTIIDERRGFNYSHGDWFELITLGRHLPAHR